MNKVEKMEKSDLDSRLNDLWHRRARLTDREWNELHTLIGQILNGYHPPILQSLADDKTGYINEFFARKVFESTSRATEQSIHAGAIRVFFKNFLHDCLDSQNRNILSGAESLHPVEDDDGRLHRPPEPQGDANIVLDMLAEHGLNAVRVREAAVCWLDAQESWVPLYLGLHHCPDADASLPLVHLAERHAIASYHHKARKLGLTRRKDAHDQAWFQKTLLGKWIEEDLGLTIEADNRLAIQVVLALLCEIALARVIEPVSRIDVSKSTDGAR
ncbi:MAG: hypothetical protein WCP34_11690 [Pseudomonadota bacterium]